MKLAIVNYLQDPSPSSGVYKRLACQALACDRAAIPMDFHAIASRTFPSPNPLVAVSSIGEHKSTLAKNRRECEAVMSIMREYDVVCLRSMLFSHHYWDLFRRRPARLVSEFHGKHLVDRRKDSLKLFAYEALFISPGLAVNDGFISMTSEIDAYIHSLPLAGGKPSRVIPNGIDVQAIPPTGFLPFEGNELHLCQIASIDAPWHGWERLKAGLEAYKGKTRIILHLIGGYPGEATEHVGISGTIVRHGPLSGSQLDSVLSKMNLAVTTLGLHRKKQRQACSLKTREYMARGIPFVTAYEDVDMPTPLPYVLQLSPDESPVDFEKVLGFSAGFSAAEAPQTARTMRAWAGEHLDWGIKMKHYQSFMESLEA